MMKEWPTDGATVRFVDLADPIVEAIRFAYDVKRKNRGKDIPWNGYNIGERALLSCHNQQERLTAGSLAYAESDQGRDALTEIISVAVQLGIEQGRRMEWEHMADWLPLAKLSMTSVQEFLDRLSTYNWKPSPEEFRKATEKRD